MNYELNKMDFTTLQIGIEKNVARIALNRPEVRNAMNALMIKELTEAVDWLDARDDIRVIEICGNGKSFCAGADINYMKDIASFGYEQNIEDAKRLSKLFQKIYFCNKPVITLVHGAVIGGGNGIIAASDVVLAEKDTVFAFSEVKLGLTPATNNERLRPRRVANKPEMALPRIQPIKALEDVMPCRASVYSKSAPIKNACKPFSAPEITAVS